jgi:uncharacterized membrane protein
MPLKSSDLSPSFAARFRRNFVTGLLVLAPLWLTIYVILLAVKILGGFLSPYFRMLGRNVIGSGKSLTLVTALADITAFIVTVIGITLIGMLVRRVLGQRLVEAFNRLMNHIPVVRAIYESIRKFIDIFFGDKSKFQRVVAVNFPLESAWTIGFVTGETKLNPDPQSNQPMLTIFVPKVPNPTSGFLLFAKEDDVRPLDLSVDEAIKLIISGGTLSPERYIPDPK